ncbi:MAG: type II toxin-antitoxin system Phd/YefM family antitoxin [Defluviitaleaceae bacterium]|nr:type II toxin-antitoxin system Phd/YefM family antitoxin [Defluviitaleaceae bacterium]
MLVTSTEFKTNLGRYLDMLDNEIITITRNGRKVARLIKAEDDSLSDIRSLFGILANTECSQMTDPEIKEIIREERGKRYDTAN